MTDSTSGRSTQEHDVETYWTVDPEAPKGHLLSNSDLEANVPMIRASIEALGFKFSDVKILSQTVSVGGKRCLAPVTVLRVR